MYSVSQRTQRKAKGTVERYSLKGISFTQIGEIDECCRVVMLMRDGIRQRDGVLAPPSFGVYSSLHCDGRRKFPPKVVGGRHAREMRRAQYAATERRALDP